MKRSSVLLMISGVLAAMMLTLVQNFIFGPILSLMVGDDFANFIVLVVALTIIIKIDDVIIIPIAIWLFEKMGLERFTRIG